MSKIVCSGLLRDHETKDDVNDDTRLKFRDHIGSLAFIPNEPVIPTEEDPKVLIHILVQYLELGTFLGIDLLF